MAVIRTICMGVNLALLVIAMVPLGYSLTRIASPAHAVCLFEFNIPRKRLRQMSGSPALKCLGNPNDLNDFNTAFVAIAWTFLLVSYATRVIRLFPGSATRARSRGSKSVHLGLHPGMASTCFPPPPGWPAEGAGDPAHRTSRLRQGGAGHGPCERRRRDAR